MIDPAELAHFKRESLILAIALRKACNLIAIGDENYSSEVMKRLIAVARKETPKCPDCIHKIIYQVEDDD